VEASAALRATGVAAPPTLRELPYAVDWAKV
jgi:hypothetical protein